jgi:cytochrome c oxidase subunit 4
MSDTAAAAGAQGAKPHAHKGPNYMLVWLVLFILTVVEVLVAFVSHMPKAILILVLLVLAVWKAVLVALYYMHLRFEPRKLWWVVLSPLPLAVILVAVVLFEAW